MNPHSHPEGSCRLCRKRKVGNGEGMRYEVRGDWVNGEADQPLAYGNTLRGTEGILRAFEKWPAVRNLRIVDKEEGK